MRTEVPAFKRCCFCVPLRYGLLTWAYIKLVALAFLAIFFTMHLYYMIRNYTVTPRVFNSRDLHDITVISVLFAICLIEFCFTLSFIVGGHKKNAKLMRVFYVYNIVMWVLTLVLIMILVVSLLRKMDPSHVFSYNSWKFLVTTAHFFFTLLVQVYFMLLLRSEILKLEGKYGFSFVNNAAEGECTMREGTQIKGDWKTTDGQEENKTESGAVDEEGKSSEQAMRYP
ncbi:unnamed protein product [Spodoptera littoralis]|uniref:Uncharacterized protein n=1 Tax=Spodoptera littoralis TaxID=7109 RepID=A0A9P0MZK4_SPOLI|nr:unnamed protein product [Spodoptera littoralis]CAH1637050.1 unnamed protein product [Spodoptera littoralis]